MNENINTSPQIKQFFQIIKIEEKLYYINSNELHFSETQFFLCLALLRNYKRLNIHQKINYKNEMFSTTFNFSFISQFIDKHYYQF